MELDATEILEEHAQGRDHVRVESKELFGTATVELLGIAGGCQVGSRVVEIGYGFVRHGCSTDDVMKSQTK